MVERQSVRTWPGHPYPLGATWDGDGVNLALFSEHSIAVELYLFDRPATGQESLCIRLKAPTDQISGICIFPGYGVASITATDCTGPIGLLVLRYAHH